MLKLMLRSWKLSTGRHLDSSCCVVCSLDLVVWCFSFLDVFFPFFDVYSDYSQDFRSLIRTLPEIPTSAARSTLFRGNSAGSPQEA